MPSREDLRILIVDDDPAIARLLAAVLTADGLAEPASVNRGEDAFAAAADADLVLLDYNLPDMRGTEVLERLGRLPHPPSVVVVTAHGDESVAATALRHGADDYLVKDESLVKLLPQVVERVRRTRALRESLAAAERNLVEMERRAALGEMSVTLRHEINNPLMTAMAEIELLLEDTVDGESRKALENVQHALERIRDSVQRANALRGSETKEYLDGVRMVDLDAPEGHVEPSVWGAALTHIADRALNRVVGLLLQQAGYRVTDCPNLGDLESRTRAVGIDLVVVGCGAPGADPLERLQPAGDRGYRLVALTPDEVASASCNGADHIIRLPFDPATFIEQVSTVAP